MNYPLYTFLTVLVVCVSMLYMQFVDEENFGAVNTISSVATSTLYGGLNLSNGCFTRGGGSCLVSGLTSYERVSNTASLNTSNNAGTTATVDCTSGKKVLGGGLLNGSDAYIAISSYPSDEDTWSATVQCESTALGTCSAGNLTVYALCATP